MQPKTLFLTTWMMINYYIKTKIKKKIKDNKKIKMKSFHDIFIKLTKKNNKKKD